MKKFLSLVLALVMTMSLVTISAGAKDFTDDSKITYGEAVDVISALKVVDGYPDGSFNPSATLTRGAAAKIICNLILGPTTAGALKADAAPYKDVPADSTFAGYIAYCAKAGIISGYADGTFKPGNSLTGYAFMKMLLGALGYDKAIEGYEGSNWSINVAKRALNIGLDKGLTADFDGTKPVTREEAALYAFNTLKADMVEYDNTIIVGDVTIAGSKAKTVANTAKTEGIKNDDVMQFAEKYFSNLKKADAVDDFSRPATKWTLKNTTIGTYAEEADLTYTTEVKTGTIYSDLGLDKGIAAAKSTVYEDGNKNNTWSGYDIVRAGTDKIGGQGALTEVFYDADAGSVITVVINTYAGKVDAVYKATAAKDAYVNVAALNGKTGTFETEDYAIDDIVLFTYSDKESKIVDLAKAEIVTGTLTGYTTTSSVVVGGTTYKANKVYKSTVTDGNFSSFKTYEVDVVLDNYGNAQYVDTSKATTNYAVVLDWTTSAGTFTNSKIAKLLFTDGTVKEVTVTNDSSDFHASTDGKISDNDIVRFSVNSADKYTLTLLADVDNTNVKGDGTNPMSIVTKGQAAISLKANKVTSSTWADTAAVANGKTTFLVAKKVGSDTVYTAYKGISNVPTIKSDVSSSNKTPVTVYNKDTGIATLVYIDLTSYGTAASANKDVVFVKAASGASASYDSVIGTYYNYTVIKNGELIENFKVRNTDITGYTLYTSVEYDTDGVAKLGGGITGGKVTTDASSSSDYATILTNKAGIGVTNDGTVQASNDVIGLGNYFYGYNANSKVFFIDSDGEVSTSSIGSIGTDADDDVYFTLTDDGEIQYLFVVQQGVGTASVTTSYTMTGALTVSNTSGNVTVAKNTAVIKKGASPAAVTGLTLTAVVEGLDSDLKWVKVTEKSASVNLDGSGQLPTTTTLATALPASRSFRVTLTLTGGDVGTLSLGEYQVTT